MLRTIPHVLCLALVVFAPLALGTVAQAAVGSIVTMEGTVEIGRGGAFNAVAVGAEVESGDTIRTGTPGRARIVFQDDSVMNLGDSSTLVVDRSVFDPDAGGISSAFRLLSGKVRALVSEYYDDPLASFDVETTTAVSGVRGTEFIVAYREDEKLTEVLGLGGRVAVNSVMDRRRRGVLVHAREITAVAEGKFPTPPRQLSVDDDRYRALLSGLEFPGSGAPESMLRDEQIFRAEGIAPEDRAPGGASSFSQSQEPEPPAIDHDPQDPAHAGSDLLEQPPGAVGPTDLDIEF
jgi:hypothetical protein